MTTLCVFVGVSDFTQGGEIKYSLSTSDGFAALPAIISGRTVDAFPDWPFCFLGGKCRLRNLAGRRRCGDLPKRRTLTRVLLAMYVNHVKDIALRS